MIQPNQIWNVLLNLHTSALPFFQKLKTTLHKKQSGRYLYGTTVDSLSLDDQAVLIGQGQPLVRKMVVWQLRTQQETYKRNACSIFVSSHHKKKKGLVFGALHEGAPCCANATSSIVALKKAIHLLLG